MFEKISKKLYKKLLFHPVIKMWISVPEEIYGYVYGILTICLFIPSPLSAPAFSRNFNISDISIPCKPFSQHCNIVFDLWSYLSFLSFQKLLNISLILSKTTLHSFNFPSILISLLSLLIILWNKYIFVCRFFHLSKDFFSVRCCQVFSFLF